MPPTTSTQATDKQLAFLEDLLTKRQLNPGMESGAMMALARQATRSEVSSMISVVKALPYKPRAKDPRTPDVPAGRYAVKGPDGEFVFIKVDRPTDGRWKGYTFVKRQSGGNYINVRGNEAQDILHAIAADPNQAMRMYGILLGKCGHCGRALTDAESRAAGIGPVCAGKMGW